MFQYVYLFVIGGLHTYTRQLPVRPRFPLRTFHNLSHIDSNGDPKMVDITHKTSSLRSATAEGSIILSSKALKLIQDPSLNPKGSVIGVAKIAAVMAIKKTSDIVPLCHPLSINGIDIQTHLNDNELKMRVSVKSEGATGVEMEALVGVTVGLLTVYDMTKSVDYKHEITGVHLVNKSGGKSDFVK